jgi:sugar-specific transcriptional regulator TrmB
MADLNKLRQTKEYKIDPVQQVLAQQIEELAHADGIKEMVDKQKEMNPSKYIQNDIAQTKDAIKEKILKHFDDALFEMVNEEMSKYYLFQSSNYLTEAGYDMFEDEWFEFYHEHHGDILFQVKTEINM